ncbi:MAG: 2,4-dihydroxyhept-2-ene-1,7-dioic acid aldolase [Proteobacteria bacterium]|nr:2,4-dihydroxyhept-2-ene-1,7-dioic acid aldolase [Pseudomonadota bacterium]
MRKNKIRETLKNGGTVVNGWCAIPNAYAAEVYAHAGWDSVTLDLQHGPIDFQAAVGMMQAISTTDAVPMARVPWNDAAIIMKLLDAGSYGLICPMINTKAEAEQFVSFGRYPPIGTRSMGPNRAVQYAGADYWQHANEEVLLFAMIETQAGLKNLEEILSVKGLNGVYVGPSDLSMAMGKPPTLDPSDKDVIDAIAHIAKVTRKMGLFPGVHTDSPATAKKRFEQGYQLTTLLNDARVLSVAAQNIIKETRGHAPTASAKTY